MTNTPDGSALRLRVATVRGLCLGSVTHLTPWVRFHRAREDNLTRLWPPIDLTLGPNGSGQGTTEGQCLQ